MGEQLTASNGYTNQVLQFMLAIEDETMTSGEDLCVCVQGVPLMICLVEAGTKSSQARLSCHVFHL